MNEVKAVKLAVLAASCGVLAGLHGMSAALHGMLATQDSLGNSRELEGHFGAFPNSIFEFCLIYLKFHLKLAILS